MDAVSTLVHAAKASSTTWRDACRPRIASPRPSMRKLSGVPRSASKKRPLLSSVNWLVVSCAPVAAGRAAGGGVSSGACGARPPRFPTRSARCSAVRRAAQGRWRSATRWDHHCRASAEMLRRARHTRGIGLDEKLPHRQLIRSQVPSARVVRNRHALAGLEARRPKITSCLLAQCPHFPSA